jgi:heptosyltransferase-2
VTKFAPNARILIVKFNAIGDVVMTTPAIRDLRQAYPKAHIALLVGSWSAPVIRKNPHLDEIIEFDQQMFVERRYFDIAKLLFSLRRRRFDAAVIFHALRSIHLFIRLCGISQRFGLSRGSGFSFLTASVPENLGLERYYAANYQEVAELAGAHAGPTITEVHSDAEDTGEAHRLLTEGGLLAGESFLLVAPGGGRNPREDMAARRLPKERFAQVILDLLKDRTDLRVVLSGAESDRDETAFLAAHIPKSIDLTGKLSLPVLFSIVRKSTAVLCNDSSVLHIGIACGKPVVAPFGPTSARQRVPDWARPFVWQSDLPCSPCYASGGAAFPGCPIEFRCMRETGITQIRPLLERALAHSSRSGI